VSNTGWLRYGEAVLSRACSAAESGPPEPDAVSGAGTARWQVVARSFFYGYAGSVLGGLAVALIAWPAGLSAETTAGTAAPVGTALGLLGFAWAWRRPCMARVALRVRRARNGPEVNV